MEGFDDGFLVAQRDDGFEHVREQQEQYGMAKQPLAAFSVTIDPLCKNPGITQPRFPILRGT